MCIVVKKQNQKEKTEKRNKVKARKKWILGYAFSLGENQ